MNTLYKQFESGNTRICIEYDLFPLHPWGFGSRISGLACWNDEIGSFLPETEKNISNENILLRSRDALKKWLKRHISADSPVVIYGIHYLDKYGDLVLQKDFDIKDRRLDGAIFVSADPFKRSFPAEAECPMTRPMGLFLESEFAQLRAWATGCVFGFMIEKRCPACESWIPYSDNSSCWGFPCCTPDDKEMFIEMSKYWEKTDDIKTIMDSMGIGHECWKS